MLRDYQAQTLAASCAAFDRGVWAQAVILPTGAGKTYVFARLPDAYEEWLSTFPQSRQRMLVLAHRDRLLDQAADDIQAANPDHIVGIEQGSRRAGPLANIVVASVQTLAAAGGRRLRELYADAFRIVVVDEAHHIPAESYQTILRHFGLVPPTSVLPGRQEKNHAASRARVREWWAANNPSRLLIGVTATPNRGDSVGLEWTLQEIVYERSLRWMIDRGYLSPLCGYVLDTETDLDGVEYVAGDFKTDQLSKAVNTPARNRQTADAWAAKFSGRQAIGFAVDIPHAQDMAAAFRQAAPMTRTEWISGVDPEKGAKLAAFDRGAIDVLWNCEVLTEGANFPRVSSIIMARPTRSQSLYMQMIGRGTRLFPGKTNCAVLDVVDVSRRHSLVSLGDLFGLPVGFNMEGGDANAAAQQFERLAADSIVVPTARTFAELDKQIRTVDLWAVRESAAVNQFARLSWLQDTPSRYHVQMLPPRSENGAMRSGLTDGAAIERVELRESTLGVWTVVLMRGSVAAEAIGTTDDLPSAFARAERWIEHQRSDTFSTKLRDAVWRQRAISDKQLAALQRLHAPGDLTALTRGQAATLLDHYLAKRA